MTEIGVRRRLTVWGDVWRWMAAQCGAFLMISLYVKMVQIGLTPEYQDLSIGLARTVFDTMRFCVSEVAVGLALLSACVLGARAYPTPSAALSLPLRLFGLIVLPILSLTEVMGLAHYAYFLTPIGPEEVKTVVFAPMLISSSNVLHSPAIAGGLILGLIAYLAAPWVLRRQDPSWLSLDGQRLPAATAVAFLLLFTPAPPVSDAILAPHPAIWLFAGQRPKPAWATVGDQRLTPDAVAFLPRRSAAAHLRVSERPSNVLILLLESTRFDSLALFDAKATTGRSLLPFRDQAVLFEQVYAPVPTSAHAMFSLLYGMYPYVGAFWANSGKAVAADSMASLFQRAGYNTQLYMTSDLSYDNVRSYAATGFERVLDVNAWPGQEQYEMLPWGRDDKLLFEQVKHFLSTRDTRPFFVVAGTSNPHHPYAARQLLGPEFSQEDRPAYDRLIDYNADLVADLYTWMLGQGIADDTAVLVMGDHGEAFGDHRGNYGHAAFIYEENVHVPCFLLHPRRLGLPPQVTQLGSQMDIRATLVDLLGLVDDNPGEGVSLLQSDPDRAVISFTENGVTHYAVRDAQFSYIYSPHGDNDRLYDRRADLREQTNLGAEQPSVTAHYRTLLGRWEGRHEQLLARVLQ